MCLQVPDRRRKAFGDQSGSDENVFDSAHVADFALSVLSFNIQLKHRLVNVFVAIEGRDGLWIQIYVKMFLGVSVI